MSKDCCTLIPCTSDVLLFHDEMFKPVKLFARKAFNVDIRILPTVLHWKCACTSKVYSIKIIVNLFTGSSYYICSWTIISQVENDLSWCQRQSPMNTKMELQWSAKISWCLMIYLILST